MRRSRGPQHAIALLAGLGYFGFVLFTMLKEPRPGHDPGASPALTLAAPVLLAGLIAWWWVRGGFEGALAFSPAEAQLLFPAPITRRRLVRYKIVREQGGILLAAAMLVFFTRDAPLAWPLRFLAAWLLAATARLHQIASSLIRAGAARHGRSGLRSSAVGAAVFAVAAAAVVGSGLAVVEAVGTGGTQGQALARVSASLHAPLLAALLLPFHVVLAPFLAVDTASFLRALPAAALLAAAHYAWVLRTDAAFEEAALAAGIRRAKRLEAYRRSGGIQRLTSRSGPHRTPLPLGPSGRPAVAVAWKNGVSLLRQEGVRLLAVIAAVGVVAFAIVRFGGHSAREAADVTMGIVAAVGAFLTAFGALGFRVDLRADLDRLVILRTLPLRPRALVAAELAAPIFGVYTIQLLVLAAIAALLPLSTEAARWPAIAAGLTASVLLLPAVDTLLVGSQNALAVLYPGWVRIGTARAGGVDALGQQMLSLVATGLLLAAALAGATLVGGWAALELAAGMGRWALLPAGAVTALALYAEALAFVLWLGDRYAALDPAEAGLLG